MNMLAARIIDICKDATLTITCLMEYSVFEIGGVLPSHSLLGYLM